MQDKQLKPDVAIIGGGIIGCAIAYYCAKAGIKVLVIERGKIGGQASSVAAGLLAPSGQIKEPNAYARIATYALNHFAEDIEDLTTSAEVDFKMCGSIRLATTQEEASYYLAIMPTLKELGYCLTWLEPHEAQQCAHGITGEIFGAVYCSNEGQVSASKLTTTYANEAKKLGAEFISASALGLIRKGCTIQGIVTNLGNIYSNQTIIASGAWAGKFGKELNTEIPVIPMKGQIATIKHILPMPEHIIFGLDIYIAAKQSECLIGATSENAGFQKRTTVSGTLELLNQAREIYPDIGETTLTNMKAGFRPRTPDKLPIIGRVPNWENVSIATGHNSNGILFSATTGKIISCFLLEKQLPIDIQPYSLSRFQKETS